jgi:uncharacterized protein YlxW (UPF0749 family)
MELSGITAILFVAFVFFGGYLIGMGHTVWMALIRFKAQGYTVDEHLQLQKLSDQNNAKEQITVDDKEKRRNEIESQIAKLEKKMDKLEKEQRKNLIELESLIDEFEVTDAAPQEG